MANIKVKYNSTQAELYAICYLGWNIAKTNQPQLAIDYPEYTIAYINTKIAAITSAEELPDFQYRDLATETAHITLLQLGAKAVAQWRLLARYITRAFQSNKPLIKPNIEAAGQQYLEKASKENPNWEDLKRLLVDGKKYLTDNAAILTPVMPATFAATFNTEKTTFDNQYILFLQGEFEAPAATYNKVSANNSIYDDLLLFIDDAKEIADIPSSGQFSFAYFKGIVTSPGPAGLKGLITETGTNSKLIGASLILLDTDYVATSDADALYNFGNIASGNYNIQITLTGYQTLTVPVQIFTGVTSTKNYQLTPNP